MIRGPKKACRSVDQIVVLSPGFKSQLFQRGVPENKVAVIYNWANEDAIDSIPDGRVPMGFPGRESFRFLFAGNIGTPQGLSAVLKAAKLLLVRGVPATIMFVGTGLQLEELKRNAAARSLAKVVFFPPVSMVEVGVYLKNAHALLVHLKAAELFKITIPSKTQAYMTVGKPILMAVEDDAADLVTEARCGVIATSEDPVAIANAIQSLAEMSPGKLQYMGMHGLTFYKESLSLSIGSANFRKIFEDVV